MEADNVPHGDLVAVVDLASLAPSVHNSQPWRFTWDGRTLEVWEDLQRALPVLDPSGRERVISCGAAVLHARLAFAELGYDVSAALLPVPEEPALLAQVTVDGRRPATAEERALAAAMPVRSTDRDAFEERRLPDALREQLRLAADAEGAWVRFVDEDAEDGPDQAVELQVLLSHADERQRADPAYLAELAAWRRERQSDGIPSRALPSVPVELRGSSWVLRDFDAGDADAGHAAPTADPRPAEHPTVLVLGTADDGREDWVRAGQALARVLLRATAEGIGAQPMTQVLEVPELRMRMRHALGVLGHPQMLLRIGYGRVAPLTKRRPSWQSLAGAPRDVDRLA